MTWICPKCGNKNKDKLEYCPLCHLGRLYDGTYQKRIYMYRSEPTTAVGTFLRIVAGILLLMVGIYFLLVALFESDNWMFFFFIFFILGLGEMAIGFICVLYAIKGHRAMNMFKDGTTVIDAEVLSRHTEEYYAGGNYGGISYTYYIDIQFDASEKQYVINAKVNNDIYEKAERGNILKVTYANSNPCVLLFEGED
jgi:hypothetical protein